MHGTRSVKVQKSCKKRFNREDSFKKGYESIQFTYAHQEIGRYTKEPAFKFLFTERGGYNGLYICRSFEELT